MPLPSVVVSVVVTADPEAAPSLIEMVLLASAMESSTTSSTEKLITSEVELTPSLTVKVNENDETVS